MFCLRPHQQPCYLFTQIYLLKRYLKVDGNWLFIRYILDLSQQKRKLMLVLITKRKMIVVMKQELAKVNPRKNLRQFIMTSQNLSSITSAVKLLREVKGKSTNVQNNFIIKIIFFFFFFVIDGSNVRTGGQSGN